MTEIITQRFEISTLNWDMQTLESGNLYGISGGFTGMYFEYPKPDNRFRHLTVVESSIRRYQSYSDNYDELTGTGYTPGIYAPHRWVGGGPVADDRFRVMFFFASTDLNERPVTGWFTSAFFRD